MKALFDTNILVYAYNMSSPFYEKARLLYEEVDNIIIAQQNLLELYSVITDKRRIELPATHVEALGLLNVYHSENFTIINPTLQTTEVLLTLLKGTRIHNTEIFDAYLVATMLSNHVHTIYTADEKVFKKFRAIEIINPFI